MESNAALFLIDLNPGVGNLFDAFVAKRGTVNFNLQYVAMMQDQIAAEWFNETKAGKCLAQVCSRLLRHAFVQVLLKILLHRYFDLR